ncbi:MAG: response regulator [Myxococcota bacterium]
MSAPTVLIIEESATFRHRLRSRLEDEGMVVLEAGDGQEALDLIRQRMPDVVLQDLLLPDMEGVDLAKEIRSFPGGDDVHIIAVSAYTDILDDAHEVSVGFAGFLPKPADPEDVVAKVREELGR